MTIFENRYKAAFNKLRGPCIKAGGLRAKEKHGCTGARFVLCSRSRLAVETLLVVKNVFLLEALIGMLSKTWHSSPERFNLLRTALSAVTVDGLVLEFGVADGTTINLIADHIQGTVHGFDWFYGLPEYWRDGIAEGTWSTNGKLPAVLPNVQLHPGRFEETVPQFAVTHREPIAFMHVDCDLYSSAKTVFEYMGPLVAPGTVIVFDQYFNYPGWEKYEYRAFQEFVAQRDIRYQYLGFAKPHGFSAAVIIQ